MVKNWQTGPVDFCAEPVPELALEIIQHQVEKLARYQRMLDYAPYHIARGELFLMLKRPMDAAECFKKALECDMSAPVFAHLRERLAASV